MTALRKNWRRGFTLIEILVMAAVIGIMVGGGMAAYARYDKRQKVEQAALGFANQLRVIQKKADAGQRVGCAQGALVGYLVRASSGGVTANEDERCDGQAAPGSSSTIKLSHNAQFLDESDSGISVLFRTLSRGVKTDYELDYDGIVLVADTDHSIKYQVEVTSGGYITVSSL